MFLFPYVSNYEACFLFNRHTLSDMDWTFVQQPSNLTVKKGDNVTVTCRPPSSRPPAQVSWFKNNQLLTPTAHVTVLPSGDLFFHRYVIDVIKVC